MKLVFRAFWASILCFVFGICASPQDSKQDGEKPKSRSSSRVVFKYDKSKDLTTVRIKEFRITQLILEKQSNITIPLHHVDLELSCSYQGEKPTKPVQEVELRFHVTSSNYIFLRPQAVMAVLDNDDQGKGRAIVLGQSNYKSEAPKFNSVYEEYLAVLVPTEALTKMTKASLLDIYLGPVAYRLTRVQQGSIIEFAASLESK